MLLPYYAHANQSNIDAISSLELGKSIYQKGILPNGKSLTALGKDGLPFKINKTACIDCHRRSGLGTSESGLLISPITGEYLFKNNIKKGTKLLDKVGVPRPIYTEESLKVTIQSGFRPNGEQLHEIMPRYKLDDNNLNHLISYLKSLDKSLVPGLTNTQIDFATIITPQTPNDDKKLMLNIMNTYFEQINKDVRQLDHMKSPLHGRYKPYRRWKLHVWNLSGEPSSWQSQLEKKYAEQPIFAFLGGIGDWQPIHKFSEENKIPSLFPITDTPIISDTDFYTLYFSKGIKLDAEVVAEQLIQMKKNQDLGNILQIYNDDPASILAAKTLRNRLIENNIHNIKDLHLTSEDTITSSNVKKIKHANSHNVLIMWLSKELVLQLLKQNDENIPRHIYLSSRLMNQYTTDFTTTKVPTILKNKITIVHPFYLKNKKNQRHLLRTLIWAKAKKIDFKKEHILANTYFGLTVLTGAIHSSRYNLNREYLMEQFEHMIDNTVYHSIYPHLSLGPDQRYASKGTYLIRTLPKSKAEWIIPIK